MRFFKVIFASLLVILGIVFIIENRATLEHALQLRFDIYVAKFQSPQIPVWVLILFTFFLGVFTAALYGLYELIRQRQTIRQLRHNLEILAQELKRAEVPTTASAASAESDSPTLN
jgi:uncharacterized integral membrane protein